MAYEEGGKGDPACGARPWWVSKGPPQEAAGVTLLAAAIWLVLAEAYLFSNSPKCLAGWSGDVNGFHPSDPEPPHQAG